MFSPKYLGFLHKVRQFPLLTKSYLMTDAVLLHVFAPEIFLPYIGRGKGMYRGGGDIPFPLFAYRWLSVYPAAP
jgi:hypothetical protein